MFCWYLDQSPTLTTSTWLQSCLLLTLLLAIFLVFSSFRESLSNERCMSLFSSANVTYLTHVALVWTQHPGAFWNSSISTEDSALIHWNKKLMPIPGLIRMPMENVFFNKPRAIHSYVLLFNYILLYKLLLTSYKLMSAFFLSSNRASITKDPFYDLVSVRKKKVIHQTPQDSAQQDPTSWMFSSLHRALWIVISFENRFNHPATKGQWRLQKHTDGGGLD